MVWLIGILLVGMALFSIVGVMYMVLREQHEAHDEWYDPSKPESEPPSVPQQNPQGAVASTEAAQPD